jgi:hypothetical protein
MMAAQDAVQPDVDTHRSSFVGNHRAEAFIDASAGECAQNSAAVGWPTNGFGQFRSGERVIAIRKEDAKDRIDQAGVLGDIIRLLAAMDTQGVLNAVDANDFSADWINPIYDLLAIIPGKYLTMVRAKVALQVDAQFASFTIPPLIINVKMSIERRFYERTAGRYWT